MFTFVHFLIGGETLTSGADSDLQNEKQFISRRPLMFVFLTVFTALNTVSLDMSSIV